VNNAYRLCQGDYIQELDADDLLAQDKIERQLAALREGDSSEYFFPRVGLLYQSDQPRSLRSKLPLADLSPVEWLPEEDERKPAHAKRQPGW